MVKKAVSWVLVGVFTFLWTWVGHRWSYLNTLGNEWSSVYLVFALISLIVLLRGPRVTGAGIFDQLIGTVRSFIPTLPWLVLTIVAARSVAWLLVGMSANPLDHYTHAVVTALAAGITSALLFGAIENATD